MIKIKKISVRQTAFILIALIVSMRVVIEPSYMFALAKSDGVFCYLAAFITQIFGVYFVLSIANHNPNKSFGEICEQTFGKTLTKIIMILFFAFFALKIIGVDYEIQNFLLEVFYEELYSKIFIIPFFLVIIYVALKGPRVFARLSEVFVPFAIFVLFYTFIIALNNSKIINLLPLFSSRFISLFKGVNFGINQMGEFLALYFIMENLETDKNSKIVKACLITAIAASVFMTAFYALFVSVFGNIAISLKEGIIRMTQFSTVLNLNFRIDGISAVLWLPVNVILLCVNFFCAGKALQYIFEIKLAKSILIVFALFFITKMLPFVTADEVLKFSTNYFCYISIFLQSVFPMLLFYVFKFKGSRKNEQNYKILAKQ